MKLKLLEEAVTGWYGPRCTEYEKLCIVCAAWKEFDKVRAKTLARAENSR